MDAKKFNELLDYDRTLASYKRYMTGSPNIGGQGGGGGGTRESATPNPWLLNVAFGSSLNKRGPAATGNGPEDYWNGYYLPWVQVVPLVNLMLADRTMTSAGLTVSNAAGTWDNATGDAMYDAYVYPNGDNLDKITVTITNLPPGQYDFYLYGHADPATQVEGNSFFSAVVGNRRWGPVGTKSSVGWTADQPWVEGQQYVVLRDVQVVNQLPVILYVAPGRNGQMADGAERPPVINGLQIRRASSSSRPRPPIQTF